MKSIALLLRGMVVLLIDATHWGLDPLSPYTAKAVLLRARWERPL